MKNAPSNDASAGQALPLSIGLKAARANFIPGLIVQGAMLFVVLAYFFHEPARGMLGQFALLKARWGYGFAFAAGALAGGVLPEVLNVLVFQRGRLRRENLANLLFGILYWGSQSMVVDAFYRLQAEIFGAQAGFATVAKKVLVDQFVYNPLYAAPFAMACFEWKNQGYRFAGLSRVCTLRFYRDKIFPALLATWGVWIPLVCMIYSLPPLLQNPIFSLALTFWSMLFTWITRQRA